MAELVERAAAGQVFAAQISPKFCQVLAGPGLPMQSDRFLGPVVFNFERVSVFAFPVAFAGDVDGVGRRSPALLETLDLNSFRLRINPVSQILSRIVIICSAKSGP